MGMLAGRVAVVTGAGRGLGRAHALALAAEGAAILVNDVELAEETTADIERAGGRAVADGADVSSLAGGAGVVAHAREVFGRVDIVVNNAGVSRPAPIAELDDENLEAHLGVHLRATVGTTSAAFPLMRGQGGGRIVNTISGHGLEPRHANSAAYACAKAAVFGFTRAAALEGAPDGITVNAVAPLAYTAMSEEYLAGVDGARQRYAPVHVSRVVVFLASDRAAGITGRVLRVEGPSWSEYLVSTTEPAPTDRVEELLRA